MKISIAQIDPVIGAFEANEAKILSAYERGVKDRARICLTPELGVCGYPPHDLLDRPEMYLKTDAVLANLAAATKGKSCALVVGHVVRRTEATGRGAANAVTVFENGKSVFTQAKTLLPTYDVFDEARYFEPASESKIWTCDGLKIGLGICEDFWAENPELGRRLYGHRDPVEAFAAAKVDLLLSVSASPYEWGKQATREKIHAHVAQKVGAPLIYVNQVGANDEILFDGRSFAVSKTGRVVRLGAFQTEQLTLETSELESKPTLAGAEEISVLADGLVVGIRDYFRRTGFKSAIVGLSGGIDSAVIGALAARALGPENVLGVAMPSQVSSAHSLEDAEALARNLKCRFQVQPIKFFNSMIKMELEKKGALADLAAENLQSRLRGIVLMTLSNQHGALVIATGNKSELATGYCTLYGDMVGAVAPIGDVYKTRVYELARYINKAWGAPIPERSITKEPSAELRPDQRDTDSLPPYPALDAVLEDYLEGHAGIEQLVKAHESKYKDRQNWIQDVIRRVELNEYKRRQAAIVFKTTSKAFGIGRRIPVAKVWEFTSGR